MDHQLADVGLDHNQLQKIARPVGANHEVARRVVPKLDPHDRLSVGMVDVFIGHAVAPG